MPLSDELLSKFVKNTINNKQKTEKEVFVVGRIHSSNGQYYVKIDGSDIDTPVSITTNIDKNQPVTVMIKNHTAVVIGNISTANKNNDDDDIYNSTTNVNIESVGEDYINHLWNEYRASTK